MSVGTTTRFLGSFLVFAALGLSQDPNQKQEQVPPPPTTSAESSDDSLSKALLRIELNLKQIAEDINVVAGRMPSKPEDGNSPSTPVVLKIHELLKNDDPATLVRDFFQASQDHLLFEACLKSGKLYRNLAAEILRTRPPKSPSTLGEEFDQTAQLLFLSRMIPELELQYEGLQPQARATPDRQRAELWNRLREALLQDDQLLLGKLVALLSSTGDSPHELVIRVLSQAQRSSPSLGSTIVASMAILGSVANVWKLADVPGINPDFLSALECEKRALNGVSAAGARAALLQAFKCKTSADGSSVQAFTGSQAHVSQSIDTSSKTPVSVPNEVPHKLDIFHLPTEKELQDLQRQDSKSDAVPAVPGQPPVFGVSNTPVKRPKIPSWWIRCACPSDHPDAGIVFEGIRWHAPVLQCPNPELRRLEVK